MTENSILLVMDMMNDLVHPEGMGAKTYVPLMQSRGVYDATRRAISKARAAGMPIGYVRVGFSPGYPEVSDRSPVFTGAKKGGVFQLGTWGTEVFADFAPQLGDHDIIKHRVSPFYGTRLSPLLSALKVHRLYLSGVSTNGVVSAAVREGHDRDLECIILEDCCAGSTQEEHEYAISGLKRFAKISSAAEF